MKFKIFAVFVLTILFYSVSFCQDAYEFMRIDMSARAGALAGSFVANSDDPDVIFYNPSGIALLKDTPASFSFVKHLLDINLASLSYSKEFEGIGRFGAAIKYINYGTFTEADQFGNKTGEFGAGEVAFIIGYANLFSENIYYGANAKFIYSSIASQKSTAAAIDFGVHFEVPSQQLSVAFTVLNAGFQLSNYFSSDEDLPLDIVVGASKKLKNIPVRLSLDFHKLNQKRDNFSQTFKAFSVGAEFTLSKIMKLRLGYDNEKRDELKIGSFAGLSGFSLGVGFFIAKQYQFDYGFSSMGQIGELHRITISTNL